jgi:hypothetical protein
MADKSYQQIVLKGSGFSRIKKGAKRLRLQARRAVPRVLSAENLSSGAEARSFPARHDAPEVVPFQNAALSST